MRPGPVHLSAQLADMRAKLDHERKTHAEMMKQWKQQKMVGVPENAQSCYI